MRRGPVGPLLIIGASFDRSVRAKALAQTVVAMGLEVVVAVGNGLVVRAQAMMAMGLEVVVRHGVLLS
jgi:hypothetical protein